MRPLNRVLALATAVLIVATAGAANAAWWQFEKPRHQTKSASATSPAPRTSAAHQPSYAPQREMAPKRPTTMKPFDPGFGAPHKGQSTAPMR